jgi:hypothetical protein
LSQAEPSIVGSTVSLAVGVGYTLCAIAVALFPGLSYNFLSSLSHGANVSSLQPQEGAFTFGSYIISLVALMVWGFAVGAFYSSVFNFLTSKRKEREGGLHSSPRVAVGRV